MPAINPSLLFAPILFLCLHLLYKMRHMHLMLYELREHGRRAPLELFRQLEALHNLHLELGLEKSLPDTRDWAASPDFLLHMARHALTRQPRAVLECSSGTSTLVLARCMQINGAGKVFSLEHDPHFAQQTRAQLARHGLTDWAVVLDAPLRPRQLGAESWQWYSHEMLDGDAPIDMIAIDGPPAATQPLARYPAGPLLFHRLSDGASVFLDDAARADEQTIVRRWQAEFPDLRHAAPRCEKGCAVLTRVREPCHAAA